jgi:GH25 family lysozyme M1 (1,4-beta-N-acetylmuramidase)
VIEGTDLSQWQRDVNYTLLAQDVRFAYVKATDARKVGPVWFPFVDPMHAQHTLGCRNNGVVTGSYCFAHPTQDPNAAADFFVKSAWWDQLRPVLDYESLNADKSIPHNAGVHCLAMLDLVQELTGVRAIVYSSTSYAATMVSQCPALAAEDWWAAAYPGITAPPDYLPMIAGVARDRVVCWQWSGSSRADWVKGDVDRDACPDLGRLMVVAPSI